MIETALQIVANIFVPIFAMFAILCFAIDDYKYAYLMLLWAAMTVTWSP